VIPHLGTEGWDGEGLELQRRREQRLEIVGGGGGRDGDAGIGWAPEGVRHPHGTGRVGPVYGTRFGPTQEYVLDEERRRSVLYVSCRKHARCLGRVDADRRVSEIEKTI